MSTSPKTLVDTNVLVHLLIQDDNFKHARCKQLFNSALAGEVFLWASGVSIVELVWVLHKYKWKWNKIQVVVLSFLSTQGLTISNNKLLKLAVWRCSKTEDFVDHLLVAEAQAQGINRGYSYDKKFGRRTKLKRIEP